MMVSFDDEQPYPLDTVVALAGCEPERADYTQQLVDSLVLHLKDIFENHSPEFANRLLVQLAARACSNRVLLYEVEVLLGHHDPGAYEAAFAIATNPKADLAIQWILTEFSPSASLSEPARALCDSGSLLAVARLLLTETTSPNGSYDKPRPTLRQVVPLLNELETLAPPGSAYRRVLLSLAKEGSVPPEHLLATTQGLLAT